MKARLHQPATTKTPATLPPSELKGKAPVQPDKIGPTGGEGDARNFEVGGDRKTKTLLVASDGSGDQRGAIGAGGTVRHLGGFKNLEIQNPEVKAKVEQLLQFSAGAPGSAEAATDAAKKLAPGDLELGKLADVDDAKLVPLQAEFSQTLVGREKIVGLVKLIGHQPSSVQEMLELGNDALNARAKQAEASGKPDEEVRLLLRLNKNGDERMQAFVDTETGKVVLREKSHPLPPGVDKKIDDKRGGAFAKAMLGDVEHKPTADEAVDTLARSFPTDALKLLAKSGLRIHVLDPGKNPDNVSSTEASAIGAGNAKRYVNKKGHDEGGSYAERFGIVKLHCSDSLSQTHRATAARHEMAHALDHALGKDGMYLSDDPAFAKIFEQTEKATAAGAGKPAFPTAYSAADRQEFFAECAAMFLGDHVLPSGAAEVVTTREDLRRTNPDAYQFMKQVFEERVPTTLKSGAVQTPETRPSVQLLNQQIAELEAKGDKLSGPDWQNLARYKAIIGAETGSVPMLKDALTDAQTAQKKSRILGFVPMPVISSMTDSLAAQIQANLAQAEGR